jgi:diguanylate cyclase (GGDEF)-like protein/PAS domain S-box-containing protein
MPANTEDIRKRALNSAAIDAILMCAPFAVAVLDRENRVIGWNREAERVYGWTEQEALGHPDPGVPSPSDNESEDIRARVLAGETVGGVISRRVHRSGAAIYVRGSMSPVVDSDGNIQGHVAISEDITAQLATEMALRASQERPRAGGSSVELGIGRLEAFTSHNPNPVIETDLDGNVLYANPAATRLFGRTEELAPSHPYVRLSAQERERLLASYASVEREVCEDGAWYQQTFRRIEGQDRIHIYGLDITKRKTVESALFEEKELWRVALQTIGDGVIAVDAGGSISVLNPIAEALTGWTEREAVGQPLETVFRIVREDTRAVVTNPLRRVFQEKHVVGLANHTLLIARDGTEREIADSGAPIMDASHNVLGAILVFRDITEERTRADALERSERRYRMLFKSMAEGYALHEIVLDESGTPRDFRFLEGNPAFERLTGLRMENVQGRLAYETLSDLNPEWLVRYGKVALTGQTVEFEDYSEPLGRHIHVVAFSLGNGLFGTIFQDITARKRAQDELAAEKERYHGLLQSLQEGILEVDSSGLTTFANRRMADMLGSTVEGMIGRPWHAFLSQEEAHLARSYVSPRLSGTSEQHEFTLRRKDRSEMNALFSTSPVTDANGRFRGIVASVVDITRRRQAEDQLRFASSHDQVTGLFNRGYLEENLTRFDSPSKMPLSIAMGDVNGLKLTNDAFGHAMGDRLLRQVAEIVKSCARSEDIVARSGGDEFVILMPQTTELSARRVCDRIRLKCANAESPNVKPSIALGIATRTDQAQSVAGILRQAEDRMYHSKLTESRSTRNAIVASLGRALAEPTFETEGHTRRLEGLVVSFGKALGRVNDQIDDLILLATLHDVGKVSVPDSILMKPGSLDAEEWVMMKKHCETGYRIAQSTPELVHISEAILSHHERWDGTGYPRGLAGKDIPEIARILSIVDAYDAITAGRPYEGARGHNEALEEIALGAGTQFDPQLVHVFLQSQVAPIA